MANYTQLDQTFRDQYQVFEQPLLYGLTVVFKIIRVILKLLEVDLMNLF